MVRESVASNPIAFLSGERNSPITMVLRRWSSSVPSIVMLTVKMAAAGMAVVLNISEQRFSRLGKIKWS
jgi:hypothetical protein